MKLKNLHDELYRAKKIEAKVQKRFDKKIAKQTRRQDKVRIKHEMKHLELQDRLLDARIKGEINGTVPNYVNALGFKGITKAYLNLLGDDANKKFDKYYKDMEEIEEFKNDFEGWAKKNNVPTEISINK